MRMSPLLSPRLGARVPRQTQPPRYRTEPAPRRSAFGGEAVSAVPGDALAAIAAGLASAVTGDELTLAPGEARSFVRLLATPAYEAWLIAWGSSGALDLHDHGGAAGAVHVV